MSLPWRHLKNRGGANVEEANEGSTSSGACLTVVIETKEEDGDALSLTSRQRHQSPSGDRWAGQRFRMVDRQWQHD